MSNKEAWEKADETWRKGVEGINAQLNRIVSSYGVEVIDPAGEDFNPHLHEAIGTEPVDSKEMQDKIVSVIQLGYQIKDGERTEVIRPARVTTGEYTD